MSILFKSKYQNASFIKNNGCLLPVRSTAINFRSLFSIPTGHPEGAHLILSLSLSGCGGSGVESLSSIINGDVTGQLNKSYSTKWYDFTVKTIKTAYEYGEYEANEGYKFVIVTVSETNTFDEPIFMSAYDFNLDADGLLEEDSWAIEPFDSKVMPEEFELAVDETAEYDVVFIILDEIIDIRFIYVETDEEDNIGATFTINHSL